MQESDIPLIDLDAYKKRLNIALKAAKICVFEVDVAKQLYTFFENAEDIFGVSGDKILEDVRDFSELDPIEYQNACSSYFCHPDDFPVVDKAFQSIFDGKSTTYEARMKAAGSSYVWCKIDVTPILKDGFTVKMIGVITNISAQKDKTDRLENEIRHDHFTGLYSKEYAISLIQDLLINSPNQQHAFVLIDIDDFKQFNDTYGHDVGDYIIQSVATHLQSHFRKTDIASRFGGDEFFLLIKDIPSVEWLTQHLNDLVHCEFDGYKCTLSVGVALFPKCSRDYDVLFKTADQALYHAKSKEKANCVFCYEIMSKL